MTGKRIGLVIGNNYLNSDKELKFAVADATKMSSILLDKNIGFFDSVVLLTDKTSKDASTEIEKIFKSAYTGDLVFIYFSGHGQRNVSGDDVCLIFKDTDPEYLLSTSLSFKFINDCRKYPNARKASVIIVLDCCYSAFARTKGVDLPDTFANYCSTGMVILSSTGSTGGQHAEEDEQLKHSVFTYHLIEGLEKGYADKKDNDYISLDDWYNYAYNMTKKRGMQSPKKEGSIEGSVKIGKNPLKIEKQKQEELQKQEEEERKREIELLKRQIGEKARREREKEEKARKEFEQQERLQKQKIEEFQKLNEKDRREKELTEKQKKEMKEIKSIFINVGIVDAPIILLFAVGVTNASLTTGVFSDIFVLLFLVFVFLSVYIITCNIQSFIKIRKAEKLEGNKRKTQEEIEKIKDTYIRFGIINVPFVLFSVIMLSGLYKNTYVLLFMLISYIPSTYVTICYAKRCILLWQNKKEAGKLAEKISILLDTLNKH